MHRFWKFKSVDTFIVSLKVLRVSFGYICFLAKKKRNQSKMKQNDFLTRCLGISFKNISPPPQLSIVILCKEISYEEVKLFYKLIALSIWMIFLQVCFTEEYTSITGETLYNVGCQSSLVMTIDNRSCFKFLESCSTSKHTF